MLERLTLALLFLSTTFAATIPWGTYAIVNVATQTYINLLNDDPPPGPIVCSVGNHQSNDFWSVTYDDATNTIIQSSFDGAYISIAPDGVFSSNEAYTWTLVPGDKPYSFLIMSNDQDSSLAQDSSANGAAVYITTPNPADATQQWWFVAL